MFDIDTALFYIQNQQMKLYRQSKTQIDSFLSFWFSFSLSSSLRGPLPCREAPCPSSQRRLPHNYNVHGCEGVKERLGRQGGRGGGWGKGVTLDSCITSSQLPNHCNDMNSRGGQIDFR